MHYSVHLLLQEKKENKDFKDKDVSEIYIQYSDSYDDDKYTTTLSLMCRTGLISFEDSEVDDHLDAIPIDADDNVSSDEGLGRIGTTSMR